MGFFSKLKKGLKIGVKTALPITSIVAPPVGVALGVVDNVITRAENELGPKKGYEKALFAQELLTSEMPKIVNLLEGVYEKELVNEELLKEGLELIREGQVKVRNAFGDLGKNAG